MKWSIARSQLQHGIEVTITLRSFTSYYVYAYFSHLVYFLLFELFKHFLRDIFK